MYSEGFKYWLAYNTNATSYYRCCRYLSTKCPGRCIKEDGQVRNTMAHNHSPEPDRASVDKFRKVLTHRAATENNELYAIYCDEATSRHSEAALLYPFTSAESAMRKARRKQLPQVPNNMNDIIGILDQSKLFQVNSRSKKDPIYQKTINLEDSTCMIFMHKKTFDLFNKIDEIHVDGSVEFIPRNTPPNYYLITIHVVQGYISAPLIYAILTSKTQSAYASIFAYIREELNIIPNMIISDFDHVMQAALAYTFPEAIIKGSWFHYTDGVLSQMKSLNLQRETAKGVGASALRMLLVLPLLPAEYMAPGLESLRKWMKDKNILSRSMASLCDYIEHGWLKAMGAEKISIFGTLRSITNHIKGFNKELVNAVDMKDPTIWVILEAVTQLATKTFVKVSKRLKATKSCSQANHTSNRCNSQTTLGRPQKKNELVMDAIISSSTQSWIKTPVHLRNPLHFLQLSNHCINESLYLDNLTNPKEKINPAIQMSSSSSIQNSQYSLEKNHSGRQIGKEGQLQIQQHYQQQCHLQQQECQLQHQHRQQQHNFFNGFVKTQQLMQSQIHDQHLNMNIGNHNQQIISPSSYDNNCNQNDYESSQLANQTHFINQHMISKHQPNSNFTNCFMSEQVSNQINVTESQSRCAPPTRQLSSEPPPLIFFASKSRLAAKRGPALLSEPPPLVLIGSGSTQTLKKN